MTTLPQTASPTRAPRTRAKNSLGKPLPPSAPQPVIADISLAAEIRRVLRANIWLILVMFSAASAGGYTLNGWLQKHHSRYTSTGYIAVHTRQERLAFDSDHPVDLNPAELALEQGTQARLLLHDRLLAQVLQSSQAIHQTEWFKQFALRDGKSGTDLAAAKSDLIDRLQVLPVPNSRLISISFSWSIPSDCQTIVHELVDAHIQSQTQVAGTAETEANRATEQSRSACEAKIREITGRMQAIATDLGALGIGVGQGANGKNEELQQNLAEQLRATSAVAAAQARLKTFDEQMKSNSAPELQDALQKNATYVEYHRAVDELELTHGDVVGTWGPGSPRAQISSRRLETMRQKLADTQKEITTRTAAAVRAGYVSDIEVAQASLSAANERIGQVRSQVVTQAMNRNEYDHLQSDLTSARAQLDRIKDHQNHLGALAGTSNWSPVDWQAQPDLPDRPTFPKLWLTMVSAMGLGLTLSLGIAFLREFTDTTIRTPRDIARVGNLTLLGMIPHQKDDPKAAGARLPLAIFEAPQSVIAEQFRHLRTRLQHSAGLDTARSILITGCGADDGATTVAVNLAAGLSLNGRKILLIDANFRRPKLHQIFGSPNELGLGDVLNELDLFHDAVFDTEVPNLAMISTGEKPFNPTELLESQLLVDFIERALEDFDHVIFDGGPLLMVSDSIALAPRVDGVVTVVRARGNSRGMLTRMRDELRRLKADHLGIVLNAVRVQGGGYYGPMIRDYYAYQNG